VTVPVPVCLWCVCVCVCVFMSCFCINTSEYILPHMCACVYGILNPDLIPAKNKTAPKALFVEMVREFLKYDSDTQSFKTLKCKSFSSGCAPTT
jgi:hypothetical protein